MSILELNHIVINRTFESRNELFNEVGKKALDLGVINNLDEFIQGLVDREEELSTCFERGIAIPHCRSKCVKNVAIFIVKSDNEIIWDDNGNKAKFIIMLAVNDTNDTTHIRLLSTVARKMVNQDFTDKVLAAETAQEIYECFKDITKGE